MVTVEEIFSFLQEVAPLDLAENWDNVGVLAGSSSQKVKRVLLSLDITSAVCEEAASAEADLLISHHPVIFHPLHSLRMDAASAPVWQLASKGISAICMHTNLDIATGGVNDVLLDVVGLQKPVLLQPLGVDVYQKIVVFVPDEHLDNVRNAMASAGAGQYRNYDSCSFSSPGTGYFRPLVGTHPYMGETNRMESVNETRLEMVCREQDTPRIVQAMQAAHPYEVPAFDIFDDKGLGEPYGLGRVALTAKPEHIILFAKAIKKALKAPTVQYHDSGKLVHKVAVCSGAWDRELTPLAVQAGADTILSGEIKHSDMLEIIEAGLNLVAAGHYATEQPVCVALRRKLEEAFPAVAFDLADSGKEPVQAI
ncbi:MAG TPA: Nif3-like dinuclear metal center hexameric protein [Ruminococcaceae bacterium]|mgnify:CR=1 FL=1|nr:Nif3-like dinuclear metal center hexameric protein [Oscillospiraceae bacterium]